MVKQTKEQLLNMLKARYFFEVKLIGPITGNALSKAIRDPVIFEERIKRLAAYSQLNQMEVLHKLNQNKYLAVKGRLYTLSPKKEIAV